MTTAIELLRELASLKRYDPNSQKGWQRSTITVNVPKEMLDRVDALLANPKPYAYEVEDGLGCLELIYAQAATAQDLERPHAPLYR